MSSHPLEQLSAFLDHELEDAERRDVASHLSTCPSCARHLRELAAVDALARGLPPAGAPDGYLEALPGRVRRRIRADRPLSQRAPWVWPLAAGLALAVLAPLVLLQPRARVSAPRDQPPAAMEQLATPSPAPTPEPPQGKAVEARTPPTVGGALETDARASALSAARQDAPRRAPATAPAAPPAPEPKRTQPLAARENQAAGRLVTRDDAGADQVAGVNQPAFAPPPAAEEEAKLAEAPVQERGRAESGAASALRKSETADAASAGAEERAFRSIAALPLSTAAEARRARQAWLLFVADHPRGERLDEARVRVVEASVAAFRASGDAADRAAAERDAGAYLSQPDAPQAARAKAALRRLDDPR